MKIKSLRLYTPQLAAQKEFFQNILGFEIKSESDNFFSVQVGESEFIFEKTAELSTNVVERGFNYHYCFLIPSNKLTEALDWMKKRWPVVEIEAGREVQHFGNWNAHSFYFYDASGNLAEFIVRHDLNNKTDKAFDLSQIISVNEIGMPTRNIQADHEKLAAAMGSDFWKGDFERFGTHGDQEGLFLMVNPDIKKTWFPTEMPTHACPFEALVEVGAKEYRVFYDGGSVVIS